MSTDAEATFDALWSRTGLAGAELDHEATIRGPVEARSHGSHLPHLSIGEAAGPEELVEAQLIVEGLLGEGGMGRVHLARQPLLDRHVAIKRVRDDAPRAAAASLFREARTMGSLEHPNILPVHALGADDEGRPILVMKRISGVEWAELIGSADDHGAWSWFQGMSTDPLARHVEVLIQICGALHFAHERGVLHLDVKPENAMLAEDGGVYLLDWGIARRVEDGGRRALAGTPAYMAPEMVDTSRPVDRRTDVYLLGGCLHHVLTGRPPHRGPDLKAVMASAFASRPPDLPATAPERLAAICRRCLAADPDVRFPSALGLREALVHWIRTRGSTELAASAEQASERLSAQIGVVPPDPVGVARAFAEARFGFQQALEQWPENEVASAGLERVLRQMVAFEIDRENLDHARALLDDVGDAPELAEALERAEARVRARLELEQQSDLGVARGQRSFFISGLGVVGFAVTVGVLGGMIGDPTTLGPLQTVYIGAFFNAVILAFVAIGRQSLFRNQVNAAITWSVVAIGSVVLLGRWTAWYTDRPVPEVFGGDLQLMGLALAVGWAFLRHRGLLVAAGLCIAGSVVATVWPGIALATFAFLTTGGLLFGGLYWYRLERRR